MIDPSQTRDAAASEPVVRAPFISLGPEMLATIAAVLIIAVVTAGLLLGTSTPGPTGSLGSPSPEPGASASATPNLAVSLADIAAALQIDGRLAGYRADLQAELDASRFDASAVSNVLRRTNTDVLAGIDVATRLRQRPATADVGATLRATYADLHDRIDAALANSVQNTRAYHDAAVAVVAELARLEPLDALLIDIRAGAAATPPPSAPPSSGKPPASGSPAPSKAPASSPPSGGPPGSAPAPSGTTSNVVVNPGFEAGVGAPWELLLTPPAAATMTADNTVHHSGTGSARVDITVAGDERASVAVRQGGLSLQAGGHYLATITVRTAAAREVRVRVASAAGDTYATRLYTVGPDWQTLVVDFTSFATDPNAYIEVDLGRAAATTWLDDATFGQIAATS